jgi:Flp pilus assembly protein TadG
MCHLWRNQSGTAAVEFALVASIFFTMLFGIVDLGRYLVTLQSLDTLVAATARAMIISCGSTNFGKLSAACQDPLQNFTGTTEYPARSTIAPMLYVDNQTPQLSPTSPCTNNVSPATGGKCVLTASMPSFTFLLPVWPQSLIASLAAETTLSY